MKSRFEYKELSKAKVAESRNVVISTCSKGGFTIAQQLVAQEGDKPMMVFLKGAFHIDNVDGLYELRDAINLAIQAHNSPYEPEFDEDDAMWDSDSASR